MSFWENRFIGRPFASAIPTQEQTDLHELRSEDESGYSIGRAWTLLPEPGHDVGEDEDVVRQPFGFTYTPPVEEVAPDRDVEDEAILTFHTDEVDEVEETEVVYRRSGLLRRKRPVAVEPTVEEYEELGSSEPTYPDYGAYVTSWTLVETETETEIEIETDADADAQTEIEIEEPEVEYRRRGLFRRRHALPIEIVAEVESETEEPEAEVEWDAPDTQASDDTSWQVEEESDEVDEDAVDEEPAVEKKRRGLFGRRKRDSVEEPVELEAEEVSEDAVVDDADFEYGSVDLEATRLAALALEDEAAEEKPKKRGLFGRRKKDTEPAESETHDDELEHVESVEDDSFENVTFGPAAPVYAQADDTADAGEAADVQEAQDQSWSEPEPEALTEPEPVVVEAEEAWATYAVAESEPEAEPEPVADETEQPEESWAPVAESQPENQEEDQPGPEEAWATHAVAEAEAEHAAADEPSVIEPEAEEEPAFEHDVAEDFEPAAVAMSAESEEPAAGLPAYEPEYPEFEPDPVPLRKKNGRGGPRGRKVVGLKVGASQVAAAVVTGGPDEPALVDIARRHLEQGVVVDGELRDPEALTRALKSFFKDHKLPVKNVRLGLSSSRVGVRTFEISGVEDGARFDNAVRFKAHEVLPVAAHESVLDYRVVEEKFTESGEVSRRVLLVVAPRDQVEPYSEACRAAGLRLTGIDLESFGLLRAFVPPLGSRSRSEDSATVVVAVGHEASTLLVAGGGICEFTRVFEWGGGALQEAIAEELEVPLMEAATILSHLSLSGPGRHLDSLDQDARGRALQAVRARLTPFARELVSSLQFYQTQPESLGIREILITGGTSHLEGLADALHQMIGVSVSVGDPLGRVAVHTEIPSQVDAQIGSLAVPIGLAIEDDPARSVNLLPAELRQARKAPRPLVVAAPLAAAVPLAALAFLFMQASGTVSDREAELDSVRAQITALPEPTRPNIDPSLAGEAASRATAVAQILGGRLSWERVLGDVSRVLPAGVSLTELSATAPPPSTPEVAVAGGEAAPAPAPAATTTTPTGVVISGYTLEYASIARTLARLQAVPSLTNVELQTAIPRLVAKKRIVEFTIAADLAIPGGVQ